MADTYPLTPNFIDSTTPEYATRILEYADKGSSEQRIATRNTPKTTFALTHKYLNVADKDTLVNFFNDRQGSYLPFYFVNHVDSNTYTVRFKEDRLNIEHINAYFFNVSLDLVEVNEVV